MNVSDWTALVGLGIALAGIAAGFGISKAKLAACERRLDNLEAVRDRMGGQLHEARSRIKVLAAVVYERTRSRTLGAIAAGDNEADAPSSEQSAEGSESGET